MCKVQFHPTIPLQQQESRYRLWSNIIQGIDKGVSIFGSKRLMFKADFYISPVHLVQDLNWLQVVFWFCTKLRINYFRSSTVLSSSSYTVFSRPQNCQVLFCKIQARPRSWRSCLLWRPCLLCKQSLRLNSPVASSIHKVKRYGHVNNHKLPGNSKI